MMPNRVRRFILAHNMNQWSVYPKEDHWFAENYNSDKEIYLA